MLRKPLLTLILLAALMLTACDRAVPPPETTLPETITAPPITTDTLTEAPATTFPEETTLPATEPPHSALYIPGLSVEDAIRYFSEVCLDAEFTNSGDSSVLQKWDTHIYYCILGNPTDTDLEVLTEFVQWLNTIPGFPGMYATDDPMEANLDIHFCSQAEMVTQMGNRFENMDGAVTFWYTDNRIHDAIICIRTDLNQTLRNSVILEELYNGLGPVQDTSLREDSIIYAGYSEPQELSDIDRLILQLLYRPELQCGMDAEACAAVIRQLYD